MCKFNQNISKIILKKHTKIIQNNIVYALTNTWYQAKEKSWILDEIYKNFHIEYTKKRQIGFLFLTWCHHRKKKSSQDSREKKNCQLKQEISSLHIHPSSIISPSKPCEKWHQVLLYPHRSLDRILNRFWITLFQSMGLLRPFL